MKHRKHMIPCAIIAVIAMVVLATSRSASLGAGIGLTLILCPLVMGTLMWLLMRQPGGFAAPDEHAQPERRDQPQPASRTPRS